MTPHWSYHAFLPHPGIYNALGGQNWAHSTFVLYRILPDIEVTDVQLQGNNGYSFHITTQQFSQPPMPSTPVFFDGANNFCV